jgi:glutamyl-tRNA synthetase
MFRTRQAPSPTGYLHFGTARTMLFTQLIAKKNQGNWFLRIEDTDRARLQPEAVGSLLSSMDALCLIPDEGVNNDKEGIQDDFYKIYQKGEYGPYIQSERLEFYHKYAQQLIDKKLCYWSYITPQDKEELVTIKQITKKPINYYQANIQKLNSKPLTESSELLNEIASSKLFQSVENGLKDALKPDLKFKMLRDEILETNDVILGRSSFNLALEEDFTCIKSDGYPTYHMAHPIDDTMMKTSLVIRSQEWISSLPKHIQIFKALDFVLPEFMHVPFILSEVGNKKMSKRDGNVNIEEYINAGYLPEAIINYLAFLGWNPGTDKELYLNPQDFDIDSNVSIETQIHNRTKKLLDNILVDFDPAKIQKSPARFSIDKLNWFNKEYIKMLTPYEFNYRNTKTKNIMKGEGNYRLGDYAYVVDFQKQMILGGFKNGVANAEGIDGHFYPVGGGRDAGQSSIESLIREFDEESNGTLILKSDEAIDLAKINIPIHTPWHLNKDVFNGKTMQLYVVDKNQEDVQTFVNHENYSREYANTWNPINEVIDYNNYIRYSIWKEFCVTNSKACYAITIKEKRRILANILDTSRVTLLSEQTPESDTINNYKLEDHDIVTWKKITYEESLANLKEITPIVEATIIQFSQQKDQLLSNLDNSIIHTQFLDVEQSIEKDIKQWLNDNSKDLGSYLWPLRTILSGKAKSPSPFELLAIMDNTEILKRLRSLS